MSRADRLLRAAVSGYCALTRPRRYDAQQLQDLAMPLLAEASRDTLRYISAALSKCEVEPVELVRELARMSIDIAAPLLSRSRSLSDTDLIILIGAQGIRHARAIATRPNLHPSISQLIRLIEAKQPAKPQRRAEIGNSRMAENKMHIEVPKSTAERLEHAREKLRTIMLAAGARPSATQADIRRSYETLRDTALSGGGARFVAALSACLGINRTTAWIISRDASGDKLIMASRAIGLTEEQAYLIISALYPERFPDAPSIVSLLERFRSSSLDMVGRQLGEWQAELSVKAARSG